MNVTKAKARSEPDSRSAESGRTGNAPRLLRRYRGRWSILIGLVLILPFVLFAVLPGVFAPFDPIKSDVVNRFEPPSAEHLFGTDELGRDVFSRVVYGARTSLFAAVATILLASTSGTVMGLVAGYSGGRTDMVLMRLVDLALAFPALLLAIAVAAAAGPGIVNSMIAVAAVWWPQYARLVRGATVAIKNRPFVEAAIVTGGSQAHIMRKHILPNVATSVLIRMTLDLGYAVLFLSSLGFVGLGERPPFPEWGSMLSWNRSYIRSYWWPSVFPGIALTLVTVGVTFLGDGLTDRLDPRQRMR